MEMVDKVTPHHIFMVSLLFVWCIRQNTAKPQVLNHPHFNMWTLFYSYNFAPHRKVEIGPNLSRNRFGTIF